MVNYHEGAVSRLRQIPGRDEVSRDGHVRVNNSQRKHPRFILKLVGELVVYEIRHGLTISG